MPVFDYTPKAGDWVQIDGGSSGKMLEASGDSFTALRLPVLNGGPIKSLAVRVEVTGRKTHYPTSWGYSWVRVKVTFVGDGDPDTYAGARLYSPDV